MGFLDVIFGKDEPHEELHDHRKPFTISMKFIPRKLSAMKESRIDLEIKLKNNTNDSQLVSVDALLPKRALVGFDPTCINKHVERRLGELKPRENKEFTIRIWGSNQTKEGQYPMKVTVYSHYLDYKKVLNYMERQKVVRVE